jgi:hypothetical protein
MKNTLFEMTDFGSEPIILKSDDVRFVVIPVFELDTYDKDGNPAPSLDSESMSEMFNRVLFNLECEYSSED